MTESEIESPFLLPDKLWGPAFDEFHQTNGAGHIDPLANNSMADLYFINTIVFIRRFTQLEEEMDGTELHALKGITFFAQDQVMTN